MVDSFASSVNAASVRGRNLSSLDQGNNKAKAAEGLWVGSVRTFLFLCRWIMHRYRRFDVELDKQNMGQEEEKKVKKPGTNKVDPQPWRINYDSESSRNKERLLKKGGFRQAVTMADAAA